LNVEFEITLIGIKKKQKKFFKNFGREHVSPVPPLDPPLSPSTKAARKTNPI
jgi:hypothetical protein